MRIHLISNLFAPDELAGASLFSDIALFLKDAGHDVRVTTTFSYYPAWKLRDEDKGLTCREETFEGIPVRRISMFVPETPTGKTRMLSDLSFLWSLLRRGRFANWKPDVVVTALPMLSQCLAQRFMYRFGRVPKLIMVQDFVVEAALELGILRFPGVKSLLQRIQKWALESASTVTTISPSMLDKLDNTLNASRRRVLIPNWIHQSLQAEIDRQSVHPTAREPQRLFYAGNLGVKQGLPDFLKQFDLSKSAESQWSLRIHGGGAERKRIEETAAALRGVEVGPVLDESTYISTLRTTTACLVTQRPGVGANFLPSKLLPALATATPVLAVCEEGSPLAKEVREGRFGDVIHPEDASSLQRCLQSWKESPELLKQFSFNAGQRAVIYHRNTILPQYEQELRLLCGE